MYIIVLVKCWSQSLVLNKITSLVFTSKVTALERQTEERECIVIDV